MRISKVLLAAALLACLEMPLSAGVIGNWSGSSRNWNSGDMATLKATLIAAGHTVLANSSITSANLAGDTVFVIGEPAAAPTAAEIATLSTWITGGGVLLVFFDSGCSGCSGNNPLLSGLGTSLQGAGAGAAVAPFPGGIFATTGPPYNLVGQVLANTPGSTISGGTAIAGDFIHYQQLGSGFVFAFGDRSDHNIFNPTNANANGQLFLNIAAHGAQPVGIPEPSTISLLGAGIFLFVFSRRRR